MNRRHLLTSTAVVPLAVILPTAVNAQSFSLTALRARLEEAARFYEDHMPYDAYVPYFSGVLAGYGGLADWAVLTNRVGTVGHIVDIAVQFTPGSEFIYIPLQFSSDYWERGERAEWLTKQGH
jgi:hypothetical protein